MSRLKSVDLKVHEGAQRPGRVKRGPGLVEEVYNLIKADIISLRIPPDARISVDNLVRELGVSQTPIREALSMLEGIGLVSKKHCVGYWTAPTLDRTQFDHLFEIRLLIEPFAARRATERLEKSDLKELSDLARNMEQGMTRESYHRFADQDCAFHNRISSASGNLLVADAYSRLHAHMHIFRLRFHSEVTSEAFSEHAGIIKAMEAHDPAQAEEAMRAHLYRSYYRLVKFARD